jgi:hypothetical protein
MGTAGPKGSRIAATLLREAARSRGEKRYFTGQPCIAGHVAQRAVSNGTCVECIIARGRANPHWFSEHDEKRKQRLETDPEYGTFRRAQRAASERTRRARADKGIRAAERRKRQADQLQRTPKWANLKAIRKIYQHASWMTSLTGIPHHVDHIVPLCGELVSGLHVEGNLQIVRAEENLLKGAKFDV